LKTINYIYHVVGYFPGVVFQSIGWNVAVIMVMLRFPWSVTVVDDVKFKTDHIYYYIRQIPNHANKQQFVVKQSICFLNDQGGKKGLRPFRPETQKI